MVEQLEKNDDYKVKSIETEYLHHNSMQTIFPSVIERYFTTGYKVNLPKGGNLDFFKSNPSNMNDVCILRHSNSICLITLAPTHPVIENKCRITSISFKVTDKLDRLQNSVSGKRKRGAQWLNPSGPLCVISCDDGSKHTVYCGIRGSLVEVNERLISSPQLLHDCYKTEGYIAVVMPKHLEAKATMDDLLTEEQFKEYQMLNIS
uniref:protein Simiate-like n=1 Tax=Ciona intestinalis TaxID=7719 RepID=UPI000180AF9A|nr:protein Simiate-like [Ciona intestinalis]|eukprot:XP_002124373.1 protein Simiate-like [Ciona intestinalis]